MTERQELYCHACDRYVQFDIETELDGQHTIACPNCGHEHYRYVDKGRISDRRWASSGPVGPSYAVMQVTSSTTSVLSFSLTASATTGTTTMSSGTASMFIAQSWASTVTT